MENYTSGIMDTNGYSNDSSGGYEVSSNGSMDTGVIPQDSGFPPTLPQQQQQQQMFQNVLDPPPQHDLVFDRHSVSILQMQIAQLSQKNIQINDDYERLKQQNCLLNRQFNDYKLYCENAANGNGGSQSPLNSGVATSTDLKIDKLGQHLMDLVKLWKMDRDQMQAVVNNMSEKLESQLDDIKERLDHIEHALSGDYMHYSESEDGSGTASQSNDQHEYFGDTLTAAVIPRASSAGTSERNEETVPRSRSTPPGGNVGVDVGASDPRPVGTSKDDSRTASKKPESRKRKNAPKSQRQTRSSGIMKQEPVTLNNSGSVPSTQPLTSSSTCESAPPSPPVPLLSPETMRKIKRERVAHAVDDDLSAENKCICGFRAKSKPSLSFHVKRQGADELRYKCIFPDCEQRFFLPHNAKGHLEKQHHQDAEGLVGCRKCYKLFPSKNKMRSHLNERGEVCKDAPKWHRSREPVQQVAPTTSSNRQPSIVITLN